ncbi:tyrosine-type recombinase/integrase family protein [Kribbella sp. VKM Ac-2566]|uniref:tyrosine-type recombinase/integrase n=1 Tax=Kribbella sp. VKM Ac-2566 TaxID=2512218 RepID=UPI0010E9EAC3|nr:tyrosine-type recombinase/integrase family protein [Kribbella sp. VKM Ac-2566]TDX03542.1 integrase-like protein [Kribbella sp. VKM Ac-2566]
MRSRPGSWTDDKGRAVKHKSQARFRDYDGHVRPVSAYGKTKTAAERALLKKLQDRAKTGRHAGELTAMHKMNDLIDLFEKKFTEWVKDGTRSPTTLDNYQGAIKNHIRPALGELRIGEATTPRIDTVVAQIKQRAGAPRAKTCRAVLSGMMSLAVRYGAITVNPVREIETIEAQPKSPPRALTNDEVTLLRTSLAADERAAEADLPDLVAFMLGTGVPIGESLAVPWSQVDLEAGTVEITHTIVRVKGEGLAPVVARSRAGELGSQSAGRLIGSLQETVSRGVSVAPSTPTPRCAATRSAAFARSRLVSNPSAFVLGKPGLGKSTVVRRMALGLAGHGVQPLLLGDLKPDHRDLIEALDGQVIDLAPAAET